MEREDIACKVIDLLCGYCVGSSDDIMKMFDELIADHKLVVETMQKRIGELESEKKEFCDLLVNPYDYSDREGDEIIERAEEIIKGSK